MRWLSFGVLLVATFVLFIFLKCQLGSRPAHGPYLRSCLKKPAKEADPEAKPRFLDSVNACIKPIEKAILVLTGKGKKVKIQATPTKSLVVCRWIDKKEHCFRRKRALAPKKLLATRKSPRTMGK